MAKWCHPQGVVRARLHPEVAGQPLAEGHGVGGKQQVEPAGGLQLGIEALQQLDLGGLMGRRSAMEQTNSKQKASAGLTVRRGSLSGPAWAAPSHSTGGGVSRVSARERNLPCSGWLTKVSWWPAGISSQLA